MKDPDVLIIGTGIIGLASAYNHIKIHPNKKITLLEKEPEIATHQSGRNSGVLHSGIYYKPGSLKAINCRIGKAAMEQFCAQEGINYKTCGKVIVAVDAHDLPALHSIYERGKANGVKCEIIERPRLMELEPYAAGIKAIYVPETGIVNFKEVCLRLADIIRAEGHQILTGAEVTSITEESGKIIVKTTGEEFFPKFIINCAGLYSDKIAAMSLSSVPTKIIPFRGEYFRLRPEAERLCNNLIYPVPDSRFPFLGVHFTRKLSGEVKCGPNAVLAFAREGYHKTDINLQELFETLTFAGFIKIAAKYWHTEIGEIWRSLNKNAFVRALQRLVPEVTTNDLVPYPSGVRAQAVTQNGFILDDFAIIESPKVVNVINAPSPGATAALSIGKVIAEKVSTRFC